jgi:hypothetical protein
LHGYFRSFRGPMGLFFSIEIIEWPGAYADTPRPDTPLVAVRMVTRIADRIVGDDVKDEIL